MGHLLAVIGVLVATLHVGLGDSPQKYNKPECPVKPPGISSFRIAPGTRLYYAWSTVQGSAKKSFLSNTLCRGKKITECSCIGYDVVGYDKTDVELQEGVTFSVNKRLHVADLYHFKRNWTNSGDFHLKCHYDKDYQFGIPSQDAYKKRHSPDSYANPYTTLYANKPNATNFDAYSGPLKVLSWTSTEVVFFDCASKDPDIRVYTTYIPSKPNLQIPYSVFDILNQVGININLLRWVKIDHKNCPYPNAALYSQLLSKKKKY